jgi:hypothetical protein
MIKKRSSDFLLNPSQQIAGNLRLLRKMFIFYSLAHPAASNGECARCSIQHCDNPQFSSSPSPYKCLKTPKQYSIVGGGNSSLSYVVSYRRGRNPEKLYGIKAVLQRLLLMITVCHVPDDPILLPNLPVSVNLTNISFNVKF